MSDRHEYLKEKTRIDELLADGFEAVAFRETLDGDVVRFARAVSGGAGEMLEILLRHPDARKYLGTVVIGRSGTSSAAADVS
jgi:hypothetical protein